tara:strand:- start:1683 stop:1868 length:186 start_codon:yes stop_codon:yes gene_type:complete
MKKINLKEEVLLDLRELLKLNINTKKAIKKVESGFFDNDINEFRNGGMTITEISDYVQMMS